MPLRAAVHDHRGDEPEQASRRRAQGRAASRGRRRVQSRVHGTLQGRAQGTEPGTPAGQSHREVRVRRRPGARGHGVRVGTARPVRGAPGRPAGRQLAAQHRAQDGRFANGRRDRADGQLQEIPDYAAPGRRRRYGI